MHYFHDAVENAATERALAIQWAELHHPAGLWASITTPRPLRAPQPAIMCVRVGWPDTGGVRYHEHTLLDWAEALAEWAGYRLEWIGPMLTLDLGVLGGRRMHSTVNRAALQQPYGERAAIALSDRDERVQMLIHRARAYYGEDPPVAAQVDFAPPPAPPCGVIHHLRYDDTPADDQRAKAALRWLKDLTPITSPRGRRSLADNPTHPWRLFAAEYDRLKRENPT